MSKGRESGERLESFWILTSREPEGGGEEIERERGFFTPCEPRGGGGGES